MSNFQTRMIDVVKKHNHRGWLVGNTRAVVIAADWTNAGFSPQEADEWLKIGCSDPYTARGLAVRGWSPEEANKEFANSGMTVAYAASLGTIPWCTFNKLETSCG